MSAAPRRARGFPPIARRDARVLVLGTLPSVASLAARQYYAHERNAFWPIMGRLFDAGPERPYAARKQRLCKAGIAVWDVLRAAHRPGSLDASIDLRSAATNDFVRFLRAHPRLRLICFNGGTAATLWRRRVLPRLPADLAAIPTHTLPSTSPAHASRPLSAKAARWRRVARAAEVAER